MSKPLLVLGARQYARVFADVFDGVCDYAIAGFVENLDRGLVGNTVLGLPVYWVDDLHGMQATHHAICCLATSRREGFVNRVADQGFVFATMVHPRAFVSDRSTLAEGTSVDVASTIAGFTTIGRHVRIGRGVTIGHDTRIDDFATIHPGVNVAGNCAVGRSATIGIGSTVLDGIEIGEGAFVSAGSLVTRKVPPFALVAGVPARLVRADYGPK